MQADYMLFRQGGGCIGFAHVFIRITPKNAEDDQVVVEVDTEGNSAVPSKEPEWFAAAVQGCTEFLRILEAEGIDTSMYQIAIVQLGISRPDTLSDAVHTAAFLATASALGRGSDYQPVFEGEWKARRQKTQDR